MRIPLVLCGLGFALATAGMPASALPLISEVFYDAAGSDDGHTFVEIFGVPGASLEGYVLDGVNGANGAVGPSVVLGGSIGLDGLFVVADSLADGTSFVSETDWLADFDFQNGPDSIVLRFGDTIVDALGYGVFSASDVFAGEGFPAPDAPAGASLARFFANVDTGDNAADFGVQMLPSPGSALLVVPEPATSILVACGLAGLAHARRRRS